MAIYLEEPLDDEPLFGVVTRYLERVPGINRSTVMKRLFGDGYSLMTTLCAKTERVATETAACWGISAQEIAERLTTYRYFAGLAPAERAMEMLERIAGKARSSTGAVGSVHPREGTRYRSRYCPTCLSEDKKAGEPLHWRRSHQLPGVVVCFRHGEILCEWEYDKPLQAFVSPGAIRGKPIPMMATRIQKAMLLKIAEISDDLLTGKVVIDAQTFAGRFRDYLEERSRYLAGLHYKRCLSRLLENTFGSDYVNRHSLMLDRPYRGVGVVSSVKVVAATALVLHVEGNPDVLADSVFSGIYNK